MEQGSNTFRDKLKAWGKFFVSPYFIKNIIIYIATIVIFFVLIVQCLKWYTRHTQQISVPAVENLPITDAIKLIKDRGLVPEIIDSVFNSTVKSGYIIPGGQQPVAGYAVKKGRTIYLTYMAFTKQPTTMPRIKGESLETAKSELKRCGLILGNITAKPERHKNLVLEARFKGALVSSGKELHKGDIIDLEISDGSLDDDNSDNSDSFNNNIDPEEY